HAPAAEVECANRGYARPGLVEPQQGVVRTVADVLRHAAERRDTSGRRPTLPDAQAFQSQCRGQRFLGLRFGSRDGSHELHDRGALAAEVRGIDAQGAEEAGPAELCGFKLVVPVVRGGEQGIHLTDEAQATSGRFDAPLGGDGRRATTSTRCARPPGADSSWYFETSFVMGSVSSLLKAARSVGDRKRTSVSTARVARRLPASFARRTRSPTSPTTRAPRAMR